MKKIIAAVLCIALMLCAYGCNADKSGEASNHDHSGETEISQNNTSVPETESSLPAENSEETENGDDIEVSVPVEEENSTEEEQDTSVPEEESAVQEESKEDAAPEPEEPEEQSEDTGKTEPEESEEQSEDTDKTEKCSHKTTKTVGTVKATCTKDGYSGDTVCSACGDTLKKGSTTKATGHKNTKIINTKIATTQQEGYTGDTYCYDCETIIETGVVIDKVVDNSDKATYTLPDGSKVTIDKDQNIRDYLLHLYTQYINHENNNIEKEILRLVNIEREKAGVAPLEWNEDGYFFTEIRAEECFESFSHTRPNGSGCETVYTDHNVLLYGYWGENLGRVTDGNEMTDTQLAELLVNAWMNSPGHRANLLEEHFTSISIAYIHRGGYHIVVQNFFGE